MDEMSVDEEGSGSMLLDLPNDVLQIIAMTLLKLNHHQDEEPAAGVLGLARLCITCTQMLRLGHYYEDLAVETCPAHWQPACLVNTLEEYAVSAALAAVGGTRLTFSDAGCDLVGRNTAARLTVVAKLMRRHASLYAHIEGHACVAAPDLAAMGFSMQRAKHVGVLLAGQRISAERLCMRGWGKTISMHMQWEPGWASRRCEIFFTFGEYASACPLLDAVLTADSTVLPPRPKWFELALDGSSFGGVASVPFKYVPNYDKDFFDSVAQHIMQHPKLQATFEKLHGQPGHVRKIITAELVGQDAELRGLFELLSECAGESASVARGAKASEEMRVELVDRDRAEGVVRRPSPTEVALTSFWSL